MRRTATARGRAHHYEAGQATLEYLLLGLVLIAMIGAFGAMWGFASQGGMEGLVNEHASHAANEMGGIVDALAF